MIIKSNGADIVSTDYWDTEHAARGLVYLSGNAGVWRLLVPDASAGLLGEMRGSTVSFVRESADRSRVVITFSARHLDDYVLTISRLMVDRAIEPGSRKLAVWTRSGKQMELPCENLEPGDEQ